MICNIQIRIYLANLYVSHLDLIPDGVEATLDVLGSLVKSLLLMTTTATHSPLRSPERTPDQPSRESLGLGSGSVS